MINITKPFILCMRIDREKLGPSWVDFKYERMSSFFLFCYGVPCHDNQNYQRRWGFEKPTALFGLWMKVEERARTPEFVKSWF